MKSQYEKKRLITFDRIKIKSNYKDYSNKLEIGYSLNIFV